MIQHMVSIHHINQNGVISPKSSKYHLENFASSTSLPSNSVFERHAFRRHLIRWISHEHISFWQVESPLFRTLLTYCFNPLAKILPQSGDTIRNWIIEDFDRAKLQLKKMIQNTPNLIHLSFDLWTSPNSLAMLGVVGHWMNENHQLTIAVTNESSEGFQGLNLTRNICKRHNVARSHKGHNQGLGPP